MLIEVSNGELVDKVTILSIKIQKVSDPEKLLNIKREYDALISQVETLGLGEKTEEFQMLLEVNQKLWDIEDNIRKMEAAKVFDQHFIDLARSVYINNDIRADIKKKINLKTKSNLIEEKDYIQY